MNDDERQQLAAWLQADPQHALEYRRAQGIWNATRLIPAERLRQLARDDGKEAAAFASGWRAIPGRWRLAASMALACTVTAAIIAVNPSWWQNTPAYQVSLSTRHGEQRNAALPDTSELTLNTATELTVRFYDDKRYVLLQSGEAAFQVAPDAQRPFYVQAGDVTVRVTGTHFHVRRQQDRIQVAVASGSVQVQQGPWWNRHAIDLRPGQVAVGSAQDDIALTQAIDTTTAMAWQQGRVVFRNTPLADAIAEFNRYTDRQVRLDPHGLADVRVAGAFSIQTPEPFLRLLPDIAPVSVRYLADGTPVVMRR